MDYKRTARFGEPTGPWLGRAIWLLVIPTCCAFGPWIVDAVAPTDPLSGSMTSNAIMTEACVPLIGLLGVVGYRLFATYPVRLWPFAPFATAAACYFTALTIVVTADNKGGVLEGTTNWFPDALLAALLCQVLQPFLALVGGGLSFVAAGPRLGGHGE